MARDEDDQSLGHTNTYSGSLNTYGTVFMPPKTHHSAVAALPPRDVWEPIQGIRRRYDRQIHRWMPHVNVLYPFLPHAQFATVIPRLTVAVARVPVFQVTLRTFRWFTHRSGRCTIWLDPEPHDAFMRLHATLHEAFPAYDDQSRFAGGFTPHLSVGQVTRRELPHLLVTLQATWEAVRFDLTEVALIWREAAGPFQVACHLPLGREHGEEAKVEL